MREFISAKRGQYSLLPPSIEEWLPENHLARFVVEAVEMLDLSEIYRAYGQVGSKPYDPKMLLGLLFYGYATGIFSSRKLEQASYDSVAIRYICGNEHPDHDTIATFRKRFLPKLENLFVQILLLAQQIGFAQVGQVNIDGTKMKANASKHHAMSYDRIKKLEAQYKEEVERLLALAETSDEQGHGLDIPAELARREERLARLQQASKVLEERARADYEDQKQDYDRKMAQRKEQEDRTGKKPRGKAPQAPNPEVDPQSQYNFSDEESRIMKTKDGFDQCYNAQAAVTNDMLVVATHVSDQPNDKQQLEPVLDALPEQVGRVENVTADTGYFSEANIQLTQDRNIDPYIASGRQAHNQWLNEQLNPAPQSTDLPEDATPKECMARKLGTREGKQIYRQRKMTVEPVFGIIKEAMGFRRFLLRGLEQVKGEWSLVCMSYNLKRLFNLKTQRDKSVQSAQNAENKQKTASQTEQLAVFFRKLAVTICAASQQLLNPSSHGGLQRLNIGNLACYPTGC
mgnify:CR=1 FL=1